MTTITLELPESLVQRADRAAQAMHRPVEEVITVMLDGVLPLLDDVPPEMQAELVEMTWLDDDRLLTIADSSMSDEDQERIAELSNHEGLAPAQYAVLTALRDSYGKMTLRKARALALLSVRSGKRLLADTQAA
jgi:hypothetical protein